jgi:glycosyltransferase involved in cell wall biosynthesis
MPTEQPLVSILIPTYNQKQYVGQTVESCLSQTYPRIEVIVVDDGSTDGTGKLLQECYGSQIRYLHQENRGVSAARNTATQAANGEFIQYCDSDDQLLPTKIEQCVNALLQQPDAALVYTHCDYVEEDGITVISRAHPVLPSGDVFCELLTGPAGNFIPQCTPVIRRQAVLDVGGFNETVRGAEDWDLWLRLAALHPFVFLNDILALYRVRANGIHADALGMATARLQVIQLARHYKGREYCLDDVAYDQLEAGRYHVLGMLYWKKGNRPEARQAFREAIRLDPAHAPIRRLYLASSYIFPSSSASVIQKMNVWRKRIQARS